MKMEILSDEQIEAMACGWASDNSPEGRRVEALIATVRALKAELAEARDATDAWRNDAARFSEQQQAAEAQVAVLREALDTLYNVAAGSWFANDGTDSGEETQAMMRACLVLATTADRAKKLIDVVRAATDVLDPHVTACLLDPGYTIAMIGCATNKVRQLEQKIAALAALDEKERA